MVQVVIDLKGVKEKLSPQAQQRGQYTIANQALADMNPFVPFKEGITRMTGSIDSDGRAITWKTPYVRRLFYMMMYNYTTPGTGPRWDMKAKSQHLDDWKRAYLKGAGY